MNRLKKILKAKDIDFQFTISEDGKSGVLVKEGFVDIIIESDANNRYKISYFSKITNKQIMNEYIDGTKGNLSVGMVLDEIMATKVSPQIMSLSLKLMVTHANNIEYNNNIKDTIECLEGVEKYW